MARELLFFEKLGEVLEDGAGSDIFPVFVAGFEDFSLGVS